MTMTDRKSLLDGSDAMRVAVLLAALLIILVGVVGFISPDAVMSLRREYLVTGYGMYVVAAFRVALGILLIRFAPASRVPKILRVLGVLICLQGLVQGAGSALISLERARRMLEWEAAQGGLLRLGALIALAIGGFIGYTATKAPARLPK